MALVSRWKMDFDATDSGSAGNDGTATAVTYDRDFRVQGGSSGVFDGTAYITPGTYIDLFQYTNFTVSAWFRRTATSDYPCIINEGNTGDNDPSLLLQINGVTDGMRYLVKKLDGTVLEDTSGATLLIEDGVWHHVALVDANGTWQMYIDSAAEVNDAYTRASVGGNNSSIGARRRAGTSNPFVGNLDDVRIYDEALTAGQVLALYNEYKPPAWENYVSRWKLDGDATDYCGVNDGTATNVTYQTARRIQGYSGYFLEASDSKISCSDSDSLDPGAGDFTISAWLYPVAGNSATEGIISKMGDAASENYAGWQVYANWSGSVHTLRSYVKDSSGNTVHDDDDVYTLVNNKWQHMVFTISGNNTYLYINGAQVSTEAGTIATVATGETFYIGYRDIDASQQSWNGYIDDVRVYNVALTATEARGLYNNYFEASKGFQGSNI